MSVTHEPWPDVAALIKERDHLRAEVAVLESRSDKLQHDAENLLNDAYRLTNERDQLRAENSALIEQCAQACEAEAVDYEATGEDGDHAYNAALKHAAAAIRALKSTRATGAESLQSIEPIPGTTDALAKLTIRGG